MGRDLKKIVAEMTLEEKAGLCSGLDFWHLKGIDRLGIPSIMMSDGPHGLRKQAAENDNFNFSTGIPATCFPSAAGLASTWNRELIYRTGAALGKECQAENVSILLGPGANIKRSPLCGRNFEYFSEDPFLSSQMAASHIKGVQSQGVGTSLKHFAANNQEHRRMSVDVQADERTLREIYFASFEDAVKEAQPWTVMCSYNKVNGRYASESDYLLNGILKNEWGLEGFVVSDWGAVDERAAALESGLDLEMPSSHGIGDRKIIDAITAGNLDEEKLNFAVERLLTIIFKALDNKKENAVYDKELHHQLAGEAARESMVLLKNDALLPLKRSGSIAVIGEFAQRPRYQGGGSSHVNPTRLENIFEEIEAAAGENTAVSYARGYEITSEETDRDLIREATNVASKADTVVLFAGLPDHCESEGYDREHLRMPASHLELIEAIAAVNSNLVVVLSNGAPIEMPWLGKAGAVLEGYLGGQALGGAIAALLFGDANPSGKLAETFPKKLSDNPAFLNYPGEDDKVEYKEGIFIGYRYYDKKEIEPLFPFGHGLSYTSFEYSNLAADSKEISDEDTVTITLNVKNTGNKAGKEVVQLYIQDPASSVIRPEKELKGFKKVDLQPGEEKAVAFTLDKRTFAYYNTALKDWHVETGDFHILIGKSSRDIVLSETIHVRSTVSIPMQIHRNTTIGDLLSHPQLAPITNEMLAKFGESNSLLPRSHVNAETIEMLAAMMKYMPLRALVNFSKGAFTEEMLAVWMERLNRLTNG